MTQKLEGTVYLTVRERKHGAWSGRELVPVKASAKPAVHVPSGCVEIPLKLIVDRAWLLARCDVIPVDAGEPPLTSVEVSK